MNPAEPWVPIGAAGVGQVAPRQGIVLGMPLRTAKVRRDEGKGVAEYSVLDLGQHLV